MCYTEKCEYAFHSLLFFEQESQGIFSFPVYISMNIYTIFIKHADEVY